MIFDAKQSKAMDDVLAGKHVLRPGSEEYYLIAASLALGAGLAVKSMGDIGKEKQDIRLAGQSRADSSREAASRETPPNPFDQFDQFASTTNPAYVNKVQDFLNRIYANGEQFTKPIGTDGRWGRETEGAVSFWQARNGYEPNGALTREQFHEMERQASEHRALLGGARASFASAQRCATAADTRTSVAIA